MRAYEAYKQIDLPWLDRIPAHWRVQRAKTFFKVINERSVEGKEELLSVSSTQGVIKRNDANVTMFQAYSYAGYKLCWPKDLVVNSLWAWQNGLGFSNYYGIVSTAYSVYRLKNSHANYHYYNYLLRSSAFQWELRIRSKGIWKSRYILSDEDFLNSPIICPPREEQDAIVRFLDAKCAKIDRLIKLKERQIALLNEKKQIMINQAVTRGLDPNVPMKGSGVDWIGEIPEGWEVINFSRLLIEITQGWSPSTENEERQNDQWGVLSLSAVKDGEFCPDAVKPIPRTVPVNTTLALKRGDFLLTRSNTRMLVGDVCIVDIEPTKLIPSDLIYKLSLHDIIEKKFLLYFLKSNMGRMQIERSACGSSGTMPKLTHQHIKNWKIILPPLSNQNEIIAYISNRISSMNSMIKNLKKHCDILIEYRTSLISDVVTGKINILPN